jgi:hypothetical protein
MIQINLIPTVKQELTRSRRIQRLTFIAAMAVIGGSVFVIFSLYSFVYVVQKAHISKLNKDIASSKLSLQKVTDVDKILTVQSQLNSLPALHNSKPVLNRIFTYMTQLLPTNVGASQISVDTDKKKITVTGTATSLEQINIFADTLKFARFKVTDNETESLAFNKVSLESVNKREKGASYTLSFDYDTTLFDFDTLDSPTDGSKVQLVIDNKTTTRLDDPSKIFKVQSSGEVVK